MSARTARLVVWVCAATTVALTGGSLVVRHQIPLERQAVPDSLEYADAARHLATGDGFVTTVRDYPGHPVGENPPRYPPGYSLVLAPFALVGTYPSNVQNGAKIVALAYFAAVVIAALSLGGPLAALLAAVAVWASPFVGASVQLVFSDALAALLAVAILALVQRDARWTAFAAGVLAGFGVVVRLNGVVILAALLLTLTGSNRIRAALAAAPFIGALGVWQWATFGAPWRTGYSYWLPDLRPFSAKYLADPLTREGSAFFADRLPGPMGSLPNWLFYPLVVAGLLWVVTPPLVGIAGGAAAWAWRHEPAARLTLWTTALMVAIHLFYFFQAARFLAGATSMLTVMAAVAAATLVRDHAGPFAPFAYPQGSLRGPLSRRKPRGDAF